MKNIIVYSGPMCGFCDAAKRLLTRNNLSYTEIDVSLKEGLREEMKKKQMAKEPYLKYFLMTIM